MPTNQSPTTIPLPWTKQQVKQLQTKVFSYQLNHYINNYTSVLPTTLPTSELRSASAAQHIRSSIKSLNTKFDPFARLSNSYYIYLLLADIAIDKLIYDKRLTSFSSAWLYISPKPKDLARAGLSYMSTKKHPNQITCKRCNIKLFDWLPLNNPIIEHYHCSNSYIRLERAKEEPSIIFIQDTIAPPPKHSQAPSKNLQASPQAESLPTSSPPSNILTYKKHLAIFTAWPHTSPMTKKIADAGFIHQSTSKKPDDIICKRYNIKLCD